MIVFGLWSVVVDWKMTLFRLRPAANQISFYLVLPAEFLVSWCRGVKAVVPARPLQTFIDPF